MSSRTSNMSGLSSLILLSLFCGAICGLLLQSFMEHEWVRINLVSGVLDAIGRMFVASLKMLVVPLVFISLVCGVSSLDNLKNFGRIAIKTLSLYLGTTAVAISLALLLALWLEPGIAKIVSETSHFSQPTMPSMKETLISLVPSNPLKAASEGKMLQIILFSLLLGIGLTLSGEAGKRLQVFFQDLNSVLMVLVTLVMRLAPLGCFALITKVFAEQGVDTILSLAMYLFVVFLALMLQLFVTYSGLIFFIARVNPLTFLKKFKPAALFAFSTASSSATIPITLQTLIKNLGVDKKIASFSVPLGATINMDGTAIMQGVATIFISQVYAVPISFEGLLMVVLTATLASIGTAGVPGVGLITLAMVLQQVGLPVEGIGLILGVDRLLDMLRSAVNVCGDAVITYVVAHSEKSVDQNVFNTKVLANK